MRQVAIDHVPRDIAELVAEVDATGEVLVLTRGGLAVAHLQRAPRQTDPIFRQLREIQGRIGHVADGDTQALLGELRDRSAS